LAAFAAACAGVNAGFVAGADGGLVTDCGTAPGMVERIGFAPLVGATGPTRGTNGLVAAGVKDFEAGVFASEGAMPGFVPDLGRTVPGLRMVAPALDAAMPVFAAGFPEDMPEVRAATAATVGSTGLAGAM